MTEAEWTYQRQNDERRLMRLELAQRYLKAEHPERWKPLDMDADKDIQIRLERCGYRLVSAE